MASGLIRKRKATRRIPESPAHPSPTHMVYRAILGKFYHRHRESVEHDGLAGQLGRGRRIKRRSLVHVVLLAAGYTRYRYIEGTVTFVDQQNTPLAVGFHYRKRIKIRS